MVPAIQIGAAVAIEDKEEDAEEDAEEEENADDDANCTNSENFSMNSSGQPAFTMGRPLSPFQTARFPSIPAIPGCGNSS